MKRWRCIVLGAAGRDFHDFLCFFRSHPEYEVICFTAAQIPGIDARLFPRSLAGPDYAQAIPIRPEHELPELIERHAVDFVFLCYSDLSHVEVMHRASLVQAAGASFVLLGPRHTELQAPRPVLSVTASRTGAGKSPLSQHLAAMLDGCGLRVGVLRHPMPYGDLERQRVQRFACWADLDASECTIEEREEYTPYLERGQCVYAGVDYRAISELASRESDLLLWDGGNNDRPFLRPDLSLVVLDALRPGHEVSYYPGETNLRRADVLVLNKVAGARAEDVAVMHARCAELRPSAERIESDLRIEVDAPELVRGKRVLVIEDGPTLTHGGAAFGAGELAARRCGASGRVDPRPHAVGSIAATLAAYPHLGAVLPALGYGAAQLAELAETIRRAAPEAIVDASPADLSRSIALPVPAARVRYRFEQCGGPPLEGIVRRWLERMGLSAKRA